MQTLVKSTLLLTLLISGGCAEFTQRSTGIVDGRLTPCPEWPRCVSSQAEGPESRVGPMTLTGEPAQNWLAVIDVVRDMPRTQIRRSSDNYLHAEVTSPWGVYIDDLELLREGARVEVRSSARIGYYDFDVNRDRVAKLRKTLQEQGLID